jgi:hypothetical protein
MSRSVVGRSWTLILALGVLVATCLYRPSFARADFFPEETPGNTGGGPPPTGVGDPDVPVNTQFKKSQHGALGSQDASLSARHVGDSRYVGVQSVWIWRFTVLARAMRVYWYR